MGRALAEFNSAVMVRITETREHYLQCLQAVTVSMFPQDALKEQKTWMRRFLKKPADWDIKKYVARVVEINDYLVQFPPKTAGADPEKLPEDELLELLEFGIPLRWRNQLHLQNYKVQDHTIKEFTKICERLESVFRDSPSNDSTNKNKSGNKDDSRRPQCRSSRVPAR